MKARPSLRRHILPGIFVSLLFVALFQRQPEGSEEPPLLTYSGQTMGTTFQIKVRPNGVPVPETLERDIASTLEAVVQGMSTYESASELSRFNALNSTEPTKLSEALFKVVRSALDIGAASRGALDITVQPLVDIWGFGPKKVDEKPSKSAIERELSRVGRQYLVLDVKAQTLTKAKGDLWLDLSAIAKGFAVDEVSRVLTQHGLAHHFVEIGGEVLAVGSKADGVPWRVGIEGPLKKGQGQTSFPLKNLAVATSGSYRNYRLYGTETFSHTLNPITGFPVEHRGVSASVIAKTCMEADGWATAFMVLGPVEGLKLADDLNLAARFVSLTEASEVVVKESEAFRKLRESAIVRQP